MKCARHVDLRMPMCFFPLRLVTAYPTFSAHRSRYLLNIFRCEKAEEQSGMLEPRPLASSCLTSHFAHPSHLPPTTVRKNNIRERIQDGREFSEKISKSHSTINRQTLNFVIDNQNWNPFCHHPVTCNGGDWTLSLNAPEFLEIIANIAKFQL